MVLIPAHVRSRSQRDAPTKRSTLCGILSNTMSRQLILSMQSNQEEIPPQRLMKFDISAFILGFSVFCILQPEIPVTGSRIYKI